MPSHQNDKPNVNDPGTSNKAGSTHTTNGEYTKREHGRQHVPGEPVGNPMDDAASEGREQDRNETPEK